MRGKWMENKAAALNPPPPSFGSPRRACPSVFKHVGPLRFMSCCTLAVHVKPILTELNQQK